MRECSGRSENGLCVVDDSREIAEHCSFLNQVEPIEGRLISIDGGRYPMDLG